MTKDDLERMFSEWYDNRKSGMPPAAWESWYAGYMAAKKQKE